MPGQLMILKILPRYILKEFLGVLLASAMVFTFVLIMEKLFDLMAMALSRGVGLMALGELLGLFIVPLLSLTIPMASLMAGLLTYGRLSEQGEVMALRASGFSFPSFIWPPLVFGLLVSVALLPLNHRLSPKIQCRFRDRFETLAKRNPTARLEARTFFEIDDYRIFLEGVSKNKRDLQGISVYKESGQTFTHIYARTGTAATTPQGDFVLRLNDGTIHQPDSRDPQKHALSDFQAYTLTIPLAGQSTEMRSFKLREMQTSELKAHLKNSLSQGGPKPEAYKTEVAKRWALAFAPVAVLVVGIPLGITLERGRAVGYGMSLLIILIYYLLLLAGITFSGNGRIPPVLGLWLPNFCMAATGIFFLRRLLRK